MPDRIDQNTNLSIVDETGRYDMTRYSLHEAETIGTVFRNVLRKYEKKHWAMGLVNESESIVYKARYILFEIVIQRFSESDSPLDQFAVAYAYVTKGSYYRQKAIEYFEKCMPKLSPLDISCYGSFPLFSVYVKLSKLYEQEHIWDKAIHYLTLANSSGGLNPAYFEKHIAELQKKKETNHPLKQMNQSEQSRKFDESIECAAFVFLKKSGFL